MSSNHNWLVVGVVVVVVVVSGKTMNKTPRNRSIYVLQSASKKNMSFTIFPISQRSKIDGASSSCYGSSCWCHCTSSTAAETTPADMGMLSSRQQGTATAVGWMMYNNIQILHFASRSKRQQMKAIVDHQTMFVSRTEQTISSKLGWRSLYALSGYT